MIPAAYVVNPLVDTVIRADKGTVERIDISAYSRVRGFLQGGLTRDEMQGFDAALRLVGGGGASGAPLSPAEAMILWQTGLIVLPQECAEPFLSPNAVVERADYVRHGFAMLPELVTAEATRILAEHYRAWVAAGKLALGDRQANRYRAHNDPAGRVVLNALRGTVERVVGSPIKSSYAYASLYCGG
ncbi:MAG: hypothetical protein K2X44_08300, partial [Magnetospirillum sp.]|nr:hypothetical protein [Magnetospirillum sp.]